MNSLYATAYLISKLAHQGQVDKIGVDYFNHPLTVSNHCSSEIGKIVGLLHDVLEDTSVTREELANIFPIEVMKVLDLLTHDPNTPYLEYIHKVKTHPIAIEVKLADLDHNTDPARLQQLDEKTRNRLIHKYEEAYHILKN